LPLLPEITTYHHRLLSESIVAANNQLHIAVYLHYLSFHRWLLLISNIILPLKMSIVPCVYCFYNLSDSHWEKKHFDAAKCLIMLSLFLQCCHLFGWECCWW